MKTLPLCLWTPTMTEHHVRPELATNRTVSFRTQTYPVCYWQSGWTLTFMMGTHRTGLSDQLPAVEDSILYSTSISYSTFRRTACLGKKSKRITLTICYRPPLVLCSVLTCYISVTGAAFYSLLRDEHRSWRHWAGLAIKNPLMQD